MSQAKSPAEPVVRARDAGPSEVLTAALPAHWRPSQRLKNDLIYACVRGAFAVLARLPFVVVELFLLALGVIAPLVARSDRRRAEEHLRLAMPELTPGARRRLVRRMFLHLARAAAEATQIGRFLVGPRAIQLRPEQRQLLDAALAEGKGVVAVTGHIGNWELLAQVVACAGYPTTAIAKPTYDPRLTRFVHESRSRYGMRVIWRGDAAASKDMLAVFKQGGMLALLIDQDTKVQGELVPFFGRPAHTPTAAAALALRFGAPVVVAWHQRRGREHVIEVERLRYEPTGDRDADTLRLTALMTARLEAAIRRAPEQWVWMHRRWRRAPATPAASAPAP